MLYFELLPTELNEIVFSFVILNDPDDIEKIGRYTFTHKILYNKYFWINTSVSSGLEEYSAYFNLMTNTEYLKAYKNILFINEYVKKFIKYVTSLTLPIVGDTDISKLLDPNDIYYFKSHINYKLLVPYQGDAVMYLTGPKFEIYIENSGDFLAYISISESPIKHKITRLEFILVLIKSEILGIQFWHQPFSHLSRSIKLNRLRSQNRLDTFDFVDIYI